MSAVRSTRRVRVIVAGPFPVIRLGLIKMVEDDPRLQMVGEASTMLALWEKVLAEAPEVALVDWSMASQDLEVTPALLRPDLRTTSVIFLTASENAREKRKLLKMGACGVLSKSASALELQAAVWQACIDRMPLDAPATEAGAGLPAPSGRDPEQNIRQLTPRERQLIPLVCGGLRNKEVAQHLGIAESTVWHHLTAVFTKLQVEDRMGLAAFAYRHGLVPAAELIGSDPESGRELTSSL